MATTAIRLQGSKDNNAEQRTSNDISRKSAPTTLHLQCLHRPTTRDGNPLPGRGRVARRELHAGYLRRPSEVGDLRGRCVSGVRVCYNTLLDIRPWRVQTRVGVSWRRDRLHRTLQIPQEELAVVGCRGRF